MRRDKTPPATGSGEGLKRIRDALGAELDKRKGQIAEINAGIGHSRDYLRKVSRGTRSITLGVLLAALKLMGIDPGRFFAYSLGTRVDNDALLEELERFGEIHPRLARLEKATSQLEVSEPPGQAPHTVDAEALLADLTRCKGTEQRRRLGNAAKYRHPAFAAAYLEYLDALRYDDLKAARQNAEAVAVKLIPKLTGPRSERIALQAMAIGVFASAHRQMGNFATAARAVRFALALARRHRLAATIADLLQRAACVFSDHGHYLEAMAVLDEALVIYFDLDSQVGLGMVMVERGTALNYLGEYRQSIGALRKSLRLLQDDSPRIRRNRLVAHQVLALAYQGLGDLERAEVALAQALLESEPAGRLNRASLLWDQGVLALTRDAYHLAEKSLREAAEIFDRFEGPNKALVALDLTKALMAQGKTLEAVGIATSMVEYLTALRGNRVAEAAVSELVQTAVEGNLTLDGIEKVQDKLQSARDRSLRKPPR